MIVDMNILKVNLSYNIGYTTRAQDSYCQTAQRLKVTVDVQAATDAKIY